MKFRLVDYVFSLIVLTHFKMTCWSITDRKAQVVSTMIITATKRVSNREGFWTSPLEISIMHNGR